MAFFIMFFIILSLPSFFSLVPPLPVLTPFWWWGGEAALRGGQAACWRRWTMTAQAELSAISGAYCASVVGC